MMKKLKLKLKQNSNYKHHAFTLIELMVVMAIVALLIGLVGPVAIHNLEKTQAKSELLSLNNLVKSISHRAYITGQELTLVLNGKKAELFKVSTKTLLLKKNYDFLFFQPQNLFFNDKGFVSPDVIIGSYRGKPLRSNFKYSINNEVLIE